MSYSTEIWEDIEGYNGLYLISNKGGVYSKKSERTIKKLDHKGGYKKVILSNKKTKNHYIHRLVATAFIPNPNKKLEVNHINGDKTDNRVENLEWCTKTENMQHACAIGLTNRGEDHYRSILTKDNIKEILLCNEKPTVLAKKLGISYRYLREIKTGRKWNHIKIN